MENSEGENHYTGKFKALQEVDTKEDSRAEEFEDEEFEEDNMDTGKIL